MTDSAKQALLVFGGGLLLFLIFKPKSLNVKKLLNGGGVKEPEPSKRVPLKEAKIDPNAIKGNKKAENAMIVLKAYVDAYNAGEPQNKLDELATESSKEFGMFAYRRGIDNKVVVCDLSNKVILEHNG